MSVGFETVQDLVLEWAEEKGILEKATPLAQVNKTQEELTETRDAILAKEIKTAAGISSDEEQHEIIDGIGDQLVTLIILAELCGTDIMTCLNTAYLEIKDRKGKIINGTFVKQSDLEGRFK